MDVASEAGYKPSTEFEEDRKDPLIELNLTDSTEIWLIQWPINQAPDFDGQEVSLKLHHDGHLGSFEGSSGKSYEVVSYKFQDPDAMVFLSSASESKIAGKISRRVSLVHYPEPSEHNSINLKEMSQRSSAATSAMSGRHFVTTRSSQQKNSQTMSGYRSSAPSSKIKSSVSGPGEFLKPTKRRHVDEPRKSTGQSTQDSARGNSAVTSIGSLEHSDKRKPKKQKKK
ncbi:mediator-associated protein 2-like [Olea europaea var. sylvestris]|uniref:mediator-associated protein 2-like n=1 Tax=Olea europaea var. sylvestris TaxID=158386 RepID=UPI000C1D103D|nr:mediator-associated protein 2-like [Olea europaea var. sylvestris]XP_022850283.1 mediator-associated protein 2-like [Olea europaea var. sylvestris]XP_022850284.1 mediator-associated protein 2-like [Olea europaea var. sylvestris]